MINPSAYIHPSAVIYPNVHISANAYIGPLCVIGAPPEITGTNNAGCGVFISEGARLEKLVTVDAGSKQVTYVGSKCMLMAHSHVGHDATLSDRVTVSPGAKIGGHCQIGEGAYIGMNATIHQFQRIGAYALLGMGTVVPKASIAHIILPGTKWVGCPARNIGLNTVGMDRAGIDRKEIDRLALEFICHE